ncbi:MAG: glycosyltransferase family 2 protein [Acidobacteriota bacterium]
MLILTRNEELNLPRCLDAVSWSDDIVVLDSLSTDRTVEIARTYGARVYHRAFDNERDHRAASLRLPFKHPWVFNPDADEIATPALCDEMRAAVEGPPRHAAYRLSRRDMFMGRWLRHASLYPTWLVRLFRPEAVRFERSINLRCHIDGTEGRLRNGLLHYSFNNGFESWIAKHNRYSTAEAEETLNSLAAGRLDLRGLLAADPLRRRAALKELSFRLPCRPALRFLYMYFLRGGFLDGLPGYHYCRLLSIYEYMIEMKITEARRRSRNLPL